MNEKTMNHLMGLLYLTHHVSIEKIDTIEQFYQEITFENKKLNISSALSFKESIDWILEQENLNFNEFMETYYSNFQLRKFIRIYQEHLSNVINSQRY